MRLRANGAQPRVVASTDVCQRALQVRSCRAPRAFVPRSTCVRAALHVRRVGPDGTSLLQRRQVGAESRSMRQRNRDRRQRCLPTLFRRRELHCVTQARTPAIPKGPIQRVGGPRGGRGGPPSRARPSPTSEHHHPSPTNAAHRGESGWGPHARSADPHAPWGRSAQRVPQTGPHLRRCRAEATLRSAPPTAARQGARCNRRRSSRA